MASSPPSNTEDRYVEWAVKESYKSVISTLEGLGMTGSYAHTMDDTQNVTNSVKY